MSKAPICPSCNVSMVERKRKIDGKPFYGCPRFPRCSETATHEDEEQASDHVTDDDLYGD